MQVSRDSAVGRGIATTIQGWVAFFIGLYAVPGVKDFVVANKPGVAIVCGLLVGVASLVNNLWRKEVPTV